MGCGQIIRRSDEPNIPECAHFRKHTQIMFKYCKRNSAANKGTCPLCRLHPSACVCTTDEAATDRWARRLTALQTWVAELQYNPTNDNRGHPLGDAIIGTAPVTTPTQADQTDDNLQDIIRQAIGTIEGGKLTRGIIDGKTQRSVGKGEGGAADMFNNCKPNHAVVGIVTGEAANT